MQIQSALSLIVFVAWSACEFVGSALSISSSHFGFNDALATYFWGEVWSQDLWTWHATVVQFCMLFAHEHYSFVFSFNFVLLPLQIAFSNFLDVSKLQVYVCVYTLSGRIGPGETL